MLKLIFALVCVLIALVVIHQAIQWWRKRCSKSCMPCSTCASPEDKLAVSQKDSLDEHLDLLTQKLAAKESKLRLSKSKIRQTQDEIENLHAIDKDVQLRYREVMESLKKDLKTNEKDCKLLQQQIEWVSRRRAELRSEVVVGQNMYSEAVTELARGLRDIQRAARPITGRTAGGTLGRTPEPASRLWASFDKQERSLTSLRMRSSCTKREDAKRESVANALLEPNFY